MQSKIIASFTRQKSNTRRIYLTVKLESESFTAFHPKNFYKIKVRIDLFKLFLRQLLQAVTVDRVMVYTVRRLVVAPVTQIHGQAIFFTVLSVGRAEYMVLFQPISAPTQEAIMFRLYNAIHSSTRLSALPVLRESLFLCRSPCSQRQRGQSSVTSALYRKWTSRNTD